MWVKSSGMFIGFWGADAGDGHVDFYCSKDYENVADLESLSGILCTQLCPPLIDVFDDGGGEDRKPRLLAPKLMTHDLLNTLYSC